MIMFGKLIKEMKNELYCWHLRLTLKRVLFHLLSAAIMMTIFHLSLDYIARDSANRLSGELPLVSITLKNFQGSEMYLTDLSGRKPLLMCSHPEYGDNWYVTNMLTYMREKWAERARSFGWIESSVITLADECVRQFYNLAAQSERSAYDLIEVAKIGGFVARIVGTGEKHPAGDVAFSFPDISEETFVRPPLRFKLENSNLLINFKWRKSDNGELLVRFDPGRQLKVLCCFPARVQPRTVWNSLCFCLMLVFLVTMVLTAPLCYLRRDSANLKVCNRSRPCGHE